MYTNLTIDSTNPCIFNRINPHKSMRCSERAEHISAIPSDVLAKVFDFLNHGELRNAALTSNSWHHVTYLTEFYEMILKYTSFLKYNKNDFVPKHPVEASPWASSSFVLAKAQFLANPKENFSGPCYRINDFAVDSLLKSSSAVLILDKVTEIHNDLLRIKLRLNYHHNYISDPRLNRDPEILTSAEVVAILMTIRGKITTSLLNKEASSSVLHMMLSQANYYLALIKDYDPTANIEYDTVNQILTDLITAPHTSSHLRRKAVILQVQFIIEKHIEVEEGNDPFTLLEGISSDNPFQIDFEINYLKAHLKFNEITTAISDEEASRLLKAVVDHSDTPRDMYISAQYMRVQLWMNHRIDRFQISAEEVAIGEATDNNAVYAALIKLLDEPFTDLNMRANIQLTLADLIRQKHIHEKTDEDAFNIADQVADLENMPLSTRIRADMIKVKLVIDGDMEQMNGNEAFELLDAMRSHPAISDSDLINIQFHKGILILKNLTTYMNDEDAFNLFNEVIANDPSDLKMYTSALYFVAQLRMTYRTDQINDVRLFSILQNLIQHPSTESEMLINVKLCIADLIFSQRTEQMTFDEGFDLLNEISAMENISPEQSIRANMSKACSIVYDQTKRINGDEAFDLLENIREKLDQITKQAAADVNMDTIISAEADLQSFKLYKAQLILNRATTRGNDDEAYGLFQDIINNFKANHKTRLSALHGLTRLRFDNRTNLIDDKGLLELLKLIHTEATEEKMHLETRLTFATLVVYRRISRSDANISDIRLYNMLQEISSNENLDLASRQRATDLAKELQAREDFDIGT